MAHVNDIDRLVHVNDSRSYQQETDRAPRSSLTETVLIVSVIVVLAALMILPGAISAWAVCALALLTLVSIVARFIQATHVSLFCLLWALLPLTIPALHSWPQTLLVPITIYGLIVAIIPSLRRSILWSRVGHLNSKILILTVLTIVVSSLALVGWSVLLKREIDLHVTLIPRMPVWLLPAAGLSFALCNAAMEEMAFRGIIMQALDSALGTSHVSIVIQAVSFAAFHYLAGFPNGGFGFVMVFAYGLMLGILRRYSHGILAPWLAHVAADVTIFSVLAATLLVT